jgi:hypothetical protein
MTAESEAPLPNFFIIGAARAGTTSLAIWLGEHPQVFVPPRKEIFFFDRDANWERGFAWYRGQFSGAAGHPLVGEASTNYMCSEVAIERMAVHIPDAKLIVSLRNPVDRAYSHFCFATAWGAEQRSFAEAVADERRGRIPVAGGDYLRRGRYLEQLTTVRQHFPADALHIIVFEEMTRTPSRAVGSVSQFLGIDDSFQPTVTSVAVNPSRYPRSRWLWRSTQRYRFALRPPSARSSRLDALNSKAFPRLDPGLRADLLAEFAPLNSDLGRWLGRDLSDWSS